MAFAGRYIFSLPFLLAVLPFIKTKAGISLLQIIRLWSLFKVLKNSGRFNFNNFNTANRNTDISLDEAYRILNLNPNKKYTKDEIINSYKKIMKKILLYTSILLLSFQTYSQNKEGNMWREAAKYLYDNGFDRNNLRNTIELVREMSSEISENKKISKKTDKKLLEEFRIGVLCEK